MELREPKPHKNLYWIPIVVYKNGMEIGEFENLQQTFRFLKPTISLSQSKIYNALEDGVFEDKPFYYNNDCYQFRTYEERKQLHFEELKVNKETGRKGR